MGHKIAIELSKKKLVVFLIAGVVFVIIGYLGAVKPECFVSPVFRSQEIIRVSGIAGVCFFGIGIIFITKKLFDNKPGLIIDKFGITDNTNATSIGLIEWDDITMVERKQIMSTKFLLLHVKNPEKYIERGKNGISKRAIQMNFRTYGTPISITSNSLKINFEELEVLITREFKRSR